MAQPASKVATGCWTTWKNASSSSFHNKDGDNASGEKAADGLKKGILRMSLRAQRRNLKPLQIASSPSLIAMTGFLGNSILKFARIQKFFETQYPSADIKDESGFEPVRINAAAIGFY